MHVLRMMAVANPSLRVIATVPTGFEPGAADECQEKLASLAVHSRGRIAFDISSKEQLHVVSSHIVIRSR